MPAGAHIAHRGQSLVKVIPTWPFSHPVGHRALLGIDDELGNRTMHPRLVPTSRMPDVIRARMHDRRKRRRTLIPRLRIKSLGPAQRVRGSPRHAVIPRHLADHKVHRADLWRACHRRARLHANCRKVMPVDRRCPFSDDLRIGQRRQGLGIQLRHRRHD